MEEEKRITVRLMTYWGSLNKSEGLPDIKKFNPHNIEEVWPYCFRVSIQPGKARTYKYDYMGTPLAKLYGQDLTNMTVDSRMSSFPGAMLHTRLDEVAISKIPIQDENHLLTAEGRLIKYRACLLPFGDGKHGVTHIIAGLTCRFF
jgi:hypothetical protein